MLKLATFKGELMRLSIDEYAKHFKMSKEMIHSKLRLKKLNYIIENGETYIIVPERKTDKKLTQKIKEDKKMQSNKPKITVATLIELYKRENLALKERIKHLEAKIDKLIDDKEQMLKEERERIEKVYEAKDEQLKTILELISAKLQLNEQTTPLRSHEIHEVEALPKLVELKEYLKSLDLDANERKKIKKRFLALRGSDVRILEQNGKIFLDLNRYDYTDLLSL